MNHFALNRRQQLRGQAPLFPPQALRADSLPEVLAGITFTDSLRFQQHYATYNLPHSHHVTITREQPWQGLMRPPAPIANIITTRIMA